MKRRTLKQYETLYRNPRALFSGGPDDTGVNVILWPNGQPEIWLSDMTGKSVRLVASRGPHGLGIRIASHVGAVQTVRTDSGQETEITLYDDTPKAQAFSRWYDHQETEADVALLGPTYRRVLAKIEEVRYP